MQLDLSARESSLIWITLQRLLLTFLLTHRHLLGHGSSRAFEFRPYSRTFLVSSSSIWMINLRAKFSFAYNLPEGKHVQLGNWAELPAYRCLTTSTCPSQGSWGQDSSGKGKRDPGRALPAVSRRAAASVPGWVFVAQNVLWKGTGNWNQVLPQVGNYWFIIWNNQIISWIPTYSAVFVDCLGHRWICHWLEVTEPRTSTVIITVPCKCGWVKTPSTPSTHLTNAARVV